MDFFDAQTRAKKKTGFLLFLFALAIIGMSAAGYIVALFVLNSGNPPDAPVILWNKDAALLTFGLVAVSVGLGSLIKWLTLREGGHVIADMLGGTRIAPNETDPAKRRLLNVVEEMAIASGTPVPGVYVLEKEPSINAFAAGYSPNDAVVAVSRGALNHLTRDELQAVVGHEFSHILNGDMRLNLKLTAIIFGILLIALLGRGIVRFSGTSSSRKKDGGIFAIILAGIVIMIFGYIGYFFGRLIQAAVSRQREFLADASAVQFTRNPAAMAGALNKIRLLAAGSALRENSAMQVSHIFFAKCYDSALFDFFATHPPLEKRIRSIDPAFDLTLPVRETPAPPPPVPHVAKNMTPQYRPPAQNVTAFMASIGHADRRQVEAAQILLEQMPAELDAAAREPRLCGTLILLAFITGDGAAHTTQEKILSGVFEINDEVRTLIAELETLNPLQRLPLMQIAAGTVRTLAASEQNKILETAQKLADADNRISIFEYSLLRILKNQIRAQHEPNRVGAGNIHSIAKLTDEISVALSFIARSGDAKKIRPDVAFAAGEFRFPSLRGKLKILPATECNFRRLDAALEQLNDASPGIKQTVLQAAGDIAGSDGSIAPGEAELIRAMAAALGCPVPVLT